MTDTPSPSLDDILVKYRNGTINPDPRKWAMSPDSDFTEAKQQIQALLLELIGEDEVQNGIKASEVELTTKLTRDKLRAELREKVRGL